MQELLRNNDETLSSPSTNVPTAAAAFPGTVPSDDRNRGDICDYEGRTALSYAAAADHAKVITLLLAEGCVNMNSRDNKGHTPLSHAVRRERESAVRILLQTGADTAEIARYHDGNQTVLFLAVWRGLSDIAALLTKAKANDINARDSRGRTLLSYAAENSGSFNVVTLLCGFTGKVELIRPTSMGERL